MKHWIVLSAICVLALCLIAGFVAGRRALPSLENRNASTALADTTETRLGSAIVPLAAAHPGLSGIYPLQDSRDAFAARVLLAEAADRSLDVQYYIWQKDQSGVLMFKALRDSAERGVRVRLLLDDTNTFGLDSTLAALNAHPNIEVRLFNPFVLRGRRWIGFATDFFRLNRRMHNKSFTADNQATIIGGRNIGDEYFGAAEGMLFADLDVIAVGPVVNEVSNDFDRYWASASSYPVDRLLPPVDSVQIAELALAASLIERQPAAADYLNALRDSRFVSEMIEGRVALEWAATRMVSDDPTKGLGLAAPKTFLPEKLKRFIGEPVSEMMVVSPYFVPTAAGVDALVAMAGRGVTIKLLTNSLEATDVAPVHAGYAKRRKPLLEAGIVLYELRRMSPDAVRSRRAGLLGSSGSSLHAKTFSVDRSLVFVGSFNFDPRAGNLNTEMGLVIDSPALAKRLATMFDSAIPANAYEVRLSDAGDLYWLERREEEVLRHDTEPGTSFWQRTGIWFISLLPVEWLL